MFSVSFNVNDKQLGEILAAIHRFKIEDLDLRPVVVKGAQGRKGGKSGWEIVAEVATSTPVPPKAFKAALVNAGFAVNGISTHLAAAIKNGLIKKTAKGYVKAGEKK